MRLRRRLPFHMSAGAVGRSRTQMAAVPTKLSVSNWIRLHIARHGHHKTQVLAPTETLIISSSLSAQCPMSP